MSEKIAYCSACEGQARMTEFGWVHVGLSSHPVIKPYVPAPESPDSELAPAVSPAGAQP
jgi:hypothetical protein